MREARLKPSRKAGRSRLHPGGGYAAYAAGSEHEKLHDERKKFAVTNDFDTSTYRLMDEMFTVSQSGYTNDGSMGPASRHINGTAAQITAAASTNGHPGIADCETGTDNNGYAMIMAKNINTGAGTIRCGAVVKTDGTLSNGVNTYSIYMCLSDTNDPRGAGATTVGITHDANTNGTWQLTYGNGVSVANNATSVTVATSTWYTLEMIIDADGQHAAFYINGDLISAGFDISGATANMAFRCGITKTAGGTTRHLYVDNWFLIGEVSDSTTTGGGGLNTSTGGIQARDGWKGGIIGGRPK